MSTLLTYVASESNPGNRWAVHTDGTVLTCGCPGWTRRTHTAACRAVVAGQSCDCGGGAGKPWRTCKHVRAVAEEVNRLGGLRRAMALLAPAAQRAVPIPLAPAPLCRYCSGTLPTPEQRARGYCVRSTCRREHVTCATPRCVGVAAADVEGLRFCLRCHAAVRVAEARLRQAHARAAAEGLAGTPAAPSLPDRPDWLGGGRAILIRD